MPGSRVLRYLCFALLVLPGMPSATAENGGSITVNVRGASPGKGQAICSLFSSPETYLKQPLRSRTKPIDANGKAIFWFEQLAAGTYAVSVVYDEDMNGELNTGLLGVPTELVGISNNVKGMFGPPSFEKASFRLSKSLTIDIVLDDAKE